MTLTYKFIRSLSILWISVILRSFAEEDTIYDGEIFRPSCPDGQSLVITEATYGRTDPNTCQSPGSHDDRYCKQKHTVAVLNSHCFGRQTCNVTVSEEIFGEPCKEEGVNKYLQASYDCISADDVTEMCVKYHIKLGDKAAGYIHSRNYPNNYPKDESCIVTLTAREGYRYRFRLLDLDVENRQGMGCYDWLVVKDEQNPVLHKNYCGTLGDIHTSQTGHAENIRELTVSFRSDPMTQRRGFLIRFEEHPVILPREEL